VNEFELTPKDLFCVMSELDSPEMRDKRSDYRKRFRVESEDNSANIFDFFSLKREFVDKWVKREYSVKYEGVPLKLVEDDRTHMDLNRPKSKDD